MHAYSGHPSKTQYSKRIIWTKLSTALLLLQQTDTIELKSTNNWLVKTADLVSMQLKTQATGYDLHDKRPISAGV